jgi:hypothetical protein
MFRRRPAPSDDETARAMLGLAEAYVEGSAAEGDPCGWGPDEAARLDRVCDDFLVHHPPADVQHSMIMAMGAYLGELLVRHGGGRWTYDPAQRAAVVELPSGLRAYPHNKVAKRLDRGAEHNLFAFYQYGLTGQVPPGSKATEMS